jgi:hypothetical protein
VMGRDALYVIKGKDYQLEQVKLPIEENNNFAFQTADGIVWLTTEKGMHCLDSNLNYLAPVDLPMKNKFVSCGFAVAGNQLMFGTADILLLKSSRTYLTGSFFPAFTRTTRVLSGQVLKMAFTVMIHLQQN